MKDVEEVIAAYECSLNVKSKEECLQCPYDNQFIYDLGESKYCFCNKMGLLEDAVEILKQRDSIDIPPTYWVKETDRANHWHCPKCGYTVGLADMWDNYCPKCGIRIARKGGEKLDF